MKRADMLVCLVVLALAAICAVLGLGQSKGELICIIELSGREYGSYRLADCAQPKEIELSTEYGYNRMVITREGVQVTKSDCPEQAEVTRGMLRHAGESAICLPHHLVVRLKGATEVDAVTE